MSFVFFFIMSGDEGGWNVCAYSSEFIQVYIILYFGQFYEFIYSHTH